MAKQTLKANLFRFVTLRNPQIIEEKDKDPGFVFHPDETQSVFYEAVKDLPDEEKKAALKTVSDNFTAFKTRKEIRETYENMYAFSSWLMRNKNALSFVAILENSQGVSLFTNSEELKVWDNLIYQTVNRTSVYVRESLIQLLIVNKFLKAFLKLSDTVAGNYVFTESEEKEFTRRAYASVVISKVIFSTANNAKEQKRGSESKAFEHSINKFIAQRTITQYNTLIDDLKKVEKQYNKDTQKSFDAALKNHNKEVETLIDNATPVIIDIKDELGNIRQEKTYPDLKLPKFVFENTTVIDSIYLKDKISDQSLNIITEQEFDTYTEFSDIYSDIQEKLKTAYKNISKSNRLTKNRYVKLGGVKVNLSKTNINPYCFKAKYNRFPSGEHGFLMKIVTDYPNASIATATFKLKNEDTGIESDGLSVQMMATSNNIMTAFFHFNPILMGIGIEFTFSGEFTLDNGNTYNFSSSSFVSSRVTLIFNGCAKLNSSENPTTTPLTNTAPVYGVTNLGIADFRRVEQDVCCYVPGEVSHIENILAREYKERSTRSLLSSETTIERTDETERENLTDTTTTERNEMQSEVASVLNEDQSQSYGANANVSYSPKGSGLSFNTGAFADFSSSSSTSNSNSQAQTYAQEVTERAMERIVQKTSVKRTTRILKEFEENNKHGFDNTKGKNHITGVYRWVDKIYKNSLINYGKRLMYEFAIPEPSRFFKKTIDLGIDEGTADSAIILPVAPIHPSEYILLDDSKVNSAADLTLSNYQELASQYNAEINAIELSKTISESFSVIGNSYIIDRNYPGASNFKMEIPKGYMAHSTQFNGGFVFAPKRLEYTYATISVGKHNLTLGGASWDINTGILTLNNIQNELAVSFIGADVGGIRVNVTAFCSITPEAENQWRNETYNAIMDAYQDRLREYNEATQASEVILQTDSEKATFNPLFNRSIEKREIKRIAIELLTEQKGHDVSKDNYDDANVNSGISKVIKNADLQVHAATVKFFEQAFDWEIMAYTFYPYFYAEEKDWTNLFQEQEAADPLFQAFLQSGMARAVVPIQPGFEDAVNWYMETGEIWNGQGLVIDQDNDLYISVAEEMQVTEGVVEDTWETRLPTALTIVQADSAALKEDGLPCFCEEHAEGNTIVADSEIIGGEAGVGDGGIGKFVVS